MVPPAHPAAAPGEWARRLELTLSLGHRGILVLLTGVSPGAARPVVRAARGDGATPLRVVFRGPDLVDVPEGARVVLVDPIDDGAWLNLNRPILVERRLAVALWCSELCLERFRTEAPDFLDWVSHRIELPPTRPGFVDAALAQCARDGGLLAVLDAGAPPEPFRALDASRSYRALRMACRHGHVWLTGARDGLDWVHASLAHAEAGSGRGLVVADPPWIGPEDRVFDARPVPWAEAARVLEGRGVVDAGVVAAELDLDPRELGIARAVPGLAAPLALSGPVDIDAVRAARAAGLEEVSRVWAADLRRRWPVPPELRRMVRELAAFRGVVPEAASTAMTPRAAEAVARLRATGLAAASEAGWSLAEAVRAVAEPPREAHRAAARWWAARPERTDEVADELWHHAISWGSALHPERGGARAVDLLRQVGVDPSDLGARMWRAANAAWSAGDRSTAVQRLDGVGALVAAQATPLPMAKADDSLSGLVFGGPESVVTTLSATDASGLATLSVRFRRFEHALRLLVAGGLVAPPAGDSPFAELMSGGPDRGFEAHRHIVVGLLSSRDERSVLREAIAELDGPPTAWGGPSVYARAVCDDALVACLAHGDLRLAQGARRRRVEILVTESRLNEALVDVEQLQRGYARLADVSAYAEAWRTMAQVRLFRGERDQALHAIDDVALPLQHGVGDLRAVAETLELRAIAMSDPTGAWEAARMLYQQLGDTRKVGLLTAFVQLRGAGVSERR